MATSRVEVATEDASGLARRDLVVDGLRVAVFEGGAGEPCLLLHGYPQSHACWRRVAAPLVRSHRVIAVDWFGWGESERSLGATCEYDREVARLGALVDALGLARVNLFAHDYGGFLALGFAIRRPERLLRLAILNSRALSSFPWLPYLQFGAISWAARTPGARRLLARLPVDELHRVSLRRYVANGTFTEDDLERYVGWMRTPEGRAWWVRFYRDYRVGVRRELAARCGEITAATAIVWGDADPYCPFAIAEDLARRIPGARLTRLRGADHYVMEERPQEVLEALSVLLAAPSAAIVPR